MSTGKLIYLCTVGFVSAVLLLRLWLWLKAAEVRNLRKFRRQAKHVPVRTSTPLDNPADQVDQVEEAIQHRFSVTRRALIPIVLVISGFALALPFLDKVPAANLSLMIGALTVVLGLALRPVVENTIAGLVISASKLINVGDTLLIGNDMYGTVEDITTTHTTIKLWDWRRFVLSNAKMLETEFVNYSLFDRFVWAYVEFYVDYSADLEEVEQMVIDAANASDAHAEHETPRLWIMGADKDSIECWGAAWANSPPDAWRLKHEIRKHLLPALAAKGWAPRSHRFIRVDERHNPRPPELGTIPSSSDRVPPLTST